MPSLSILEYNDVGSTSRGALNLPLEPPTAQQSIDIGPTSSVSDGLNSDTCILKVQSEVDCFISVGVDADASNSGRILRAGKSELLGVKPGSGVKVAVIATAGGAGSVSGMDSLEGLLALIANPKALAKQIAALTAATSKHEAAAKELIGAGSAAARQDELDGREHALAVREADVAAREAEMKAKAAAIKALSA